MTGGSPASATDVDLGIAGGTGGIGPVAAWHLRNGTTARLALGEYTFGRIEGFNNQVLDAQVKLRLDESFRIRTALATLERPLAHGFTLAAGLAYNGNTIHATSVPTDSTVILNGLTIAGKDAGVIYTDVTWNRIAPYLGLRYDAPGRAGVFASAGAYYQGAAKVAFAATGKIYDNQKNFKPYYDNETSQLKKQLGPVKFYPLVSVGYRVRL